MCGVAHCSMSNTILAILILGVLSLLVVIGCNKNSSIPEAEITLVTPIQAKRTGAKNYLLSNALPQTYEVYEGILDGTDSDKKLKYVGTIGDGTVENPSRLSVEVADPEKRYFFTLRNDLDTVIVSERQLALKGSDNFRDLGGLPAADGKHIKWGLFYRSDKLSDLTGKDIALLSNLGLKTVVDLRSEEEISEAPDVLPQDVDYLHLPIYNEAEDTSNIKGQILDGTFGVEDADNLLVEVNRLFATSEAYRFQKFVDLFINGDELPLVYHCTSGKDRTGFATYLILHTLGVDSALIFDEYLMSNYYRYRRNKRNMRLANLGQYVKKVNPDVLKPLMLVDPKYLQAAVNAIREEYGTVDNFVSTQYGLTDNVKLELRERYLE